VTPDMQARFDKGHHVEVLARAILEAELGEELYPVTGYHGEDALIATSLDGMDMLGEFLFEHKLWNEKLTAFIDQKQDLPDTHWPQIEQQLYVSDAKYCLFVVSDGTADKRIIHKYFSQPERLKALIAAWDQFSIDLDDYEEKALTIKVEAQRIDALPVLAIEIIGSVKNSNLATYKSTLLARIDGISTELSTDQEFADAEAMVKFCKKAEDELKTAEKLVLGQVSDINEAIQTIADLAKAMREKRLTLDKLVKARKEQVKSEMEAIANNELIAHTNQLNISLGGNYLPLVLGGFAEAIKGKKKIDSMQSAINDYMAKRKISTNDLAEIVRANLKTYEELAGDFKFLFSDLDDLATQEPLVFKGLVQGRIADHKEAKRLAEQEAEAQRQAELKAQQEAQSQQDKPVQVEPKQEFIPASEVTLAPENDSTKFHDLLWCIKELHIPQCSDPSNQTIVNNCLALLNQASEQLTGALNNQAA
jgi:YqaJ-like viral recombinase domain.